MLSRKIYIFFNNLFKQIYFSFRFHCSCANRPAQFQMQRKYKYNNESTADEDKSKSTQERSVQCNFHLSCLRVAVLRSPWRSCFMRAALFGMGAKNSSFLFTFSLQTLLFIHPHRQKLDLYATTSSSCSFIPIKNQTHVYMTLFTQNSPY